MVLDERDLLFSKAFLGDGRESRRQALSPDTVKFGRRRRPFTISRHEILEQSPRMMVRSDEPDNLDIGAISYRILVFMLKGIQ